MSRIPRHTPRACFRLRAVRAEAHNRAMLEAELDGDEAVSSDAELTKNDMHQRLTGPLCDF